MHLPLLATEYAIPLLETEGATLVLAAVESLGMATEKHLSAFIGNDFKKSLLPLLQNKLIEWRFGAIVATRFGKELLDELELTTPAIKNFVAFLSPAEEHRDNLVRILEKYRSAAYVQFLNSLAACRCLQRLGHSTASSALSVLIPCAVLLRDIRRWLRHSNSNATLADARDEQFLEWLFSVNWIRVEGSFDFQNEGRMYNLHDEFVLLNEFSSFQATFGLNRWFQHWQQLLLESEIENTSTALQEITLVISTYAEAKKPRGWPRENDWWQNVPDADQDLLSAIMSASSVFALAQSLGKDAAYVEALLQSVRGKCRALLGEDQIMEEPAFRPAQWGANLTEAIESAEKAFTIAEQIRTRAYELFESRGRERNVVESQRRGKIEFGLGK